jgi:uncharacterized membrane protein YdjX (TVP38/TMEM64 family)
VPGISFDVISYGAGLTSIRFGPFLLATAIGVAPQAFLYAYLIREAPQSAWVFYAVSWLVIGVIGSAAFLRRKPSPAIPTPDRTTQSGSAPSSGECKAA